MSFDKIWEEIHASREWGKYPNEMFVRFLLGNYGKMTDRKSLNVLEIGCGNGANSMVVAREGFSAYGFDGSPAAIANAQKFLSSQGQSANLKVEYAENVDRIFPEKEFDVMFDIACLYAMKYTDSTNIINKIATRLKSGGRFFSIVFTIGTWGDGMGRKIEENTYDEIIEGSLAGKGVSHFFTLDDITKWGEMFGSFSIEESSFTLNNRENIIRYYLLTAQKA